MASIARSFYAIPCLHHPEETKLLGEAAAIIRHAMSEGLMMEVPALQQAFAPPYFWHFASTLREVADVWAHAMGCPELPPAGTKEKTAWALRTVARGVQRAAGKPVRDALARAKRQAEIAAAADTGKQRRRRVNRRAPSEKQIEALWVVAECGGNFAEAARRLKKDPKTVRQLYRAGLRNAGRLPSKLVPRPAGRAMPQDHRGQAMIAARDDGPAPPSGRPRVERDRR